MLRRMLSLSILSFAFASAAAAQSGDVVVGEIKTPNLRWGVEKISFEIENKSDDVKFIVVETSIKFKGEYLNPTRVKHTAYPLEPQFSKTISPLVEIPGNYGEATLKIAIFDVVDTLDDLTTATKVYEQPIFLRFHVPSAVAKYWSERITVPPMATNSPDFDDEFSHVLPVMLNDGRTPAQIAQMCECDTSYVSWVIDRLASHGYMYQNMDTVRLNFPVVGTKEAEEFKKLATQTSADLAAILTKNLPAYRSTLDSLVKAKVLDPDTNNFLNTGSVLYHPYPFITTMGLWYDLGQKFVTATSPLTVFYGTDPCHCRIPTFMYAVQGGDYFNGTQYFDFDIAAHRVQVTFGDKVPQVRCPEDLSSLQQLTETKNYTFVDSNKYEIFLWDSTTMHPALRALTAGTMPIIMSTREKVGAIAAQYVQDKQIFGLRYYFWNLVATTTLDRLVKDGLVSRRGNGQFRLISGRRG